MVYFMKTRRIYHFRVISHFSFSMRIMLCQVSQDSLRLLMMTFRIMYYLRYNSTYTSTLKALRKSWRTNSSVMNSLYLALKHSFQTTHSHLILREESTLTVSNIITIKESISIHRIQTTKRQLGKPVILACITMQWWYLRATHSRTLLWKGSLVHLVVVFSIKLIHII
jgi:hypothetical protein